MRFKRTILKNKKGQDIELRNAESSDATAFIEYLRITAGETPFLIREPEEICFTTEQEQEFLQNKINSDKELVLLAYTNGQFIGSCSLMCIGNNKRYAHRCNVAIAIYKEYFGNGTGKIMLETVLNVAKQIGYEQAELEVMTKNVNAIKLYEKLGFKKYGILPKNIKYKDGSYDNSYWMMKKL